MSGKAFFIDTTLCTACRGCQIACKQWNQLPATDTENRGSYQNPPDLNFSTYKLVRFAEHTGAGDKPLWYFFSDQCRHCVDPPCKAFADTNIPGGILIDSHTGAVLYTDKLKKADAQSIRASCPFDIPRVQENTGYMAKCTMCVDRVNNGLLPACVKTCPTGAMNFGDREEMVSLAKKRKEEVASKYPKATVTGLDDLRVFFLLSDEPDKYHKYAKAAMPPEGISRQMALKQIGNSLKELSRQWFRLNRIAG
ncbi:MAG: 4Fe-4S dicluster domain-containing protein [Desulfobacteraceae bacterium]|nr:4Fe-4S dicluster domain-containing protein [Desulfobacteraceae bacterium]